MPEINDKSIKMVPRRNKFIKQTVAMSGKPNKTILVIGPTRSGKTTTLNSMMNYLHIKL